MGKLSGEISTASINFNVIELTDSRVEDLLSAAARRGPEFQRSFRDQVLSRFGSPAPSLVVNFVKRGESKQLDAAV